MENDFKICLVIPFYNHETLIGRMIKSIAEYKLPCFLVNDGSRPEATNILNALDQEYTWLTIINRQENGGKGAAVATGFREAHKAGFTHVLQIDADCQHNVKDIPIFIAQAELEKDSLILGQAVYDKSVPKSRLYGRYITHFWVMVETLSFKVVDTMCGFRVYPLHKVLRVLDSGLGSRMDFDIEVVVKMIWKGCKIHPLKTIVEYPDDGVSHFHYLKGNICISLMHTRLCLGTLLRLPLLLKRKIC